MTPAPMNADTKILSMKSTSPADIDIDLPRESSDDDLRARFHA
jgi:hypothetical protein